MIKKAWIDSSEQEIHLVGEYVGVAWNFDFVNTSLKDGKTVIDRVRSGKPYIDAWDIYEIDEFGIADIHSDRPLAHGMGLDFAKQIQFAQPLDYVRAEGRRERGGRPKTKAWGFGFPPQTEPSGLRQLAGESGGFPLRRSATRLGSRS